MLLTYFRTMPVSPLHSLPHLLPPAHCPGLLEPSTALLFILTHFKPYVCCLPTSNSYHPMIQLFRVGQIVWFGCLSAISQLASRVGEGGGVRQLCLHSVTQPYTTLPRWREQGGGLCSLPLISPHTQYPLPPSTEGPTPPFHSKSWLAQHSELRNLCCLPISEPFQSPHSTCCRTSSLMLTVLGFWSQPSTPLRVSVTSRSTREVVVYARLNKDGQHLKKFLSSLPYFFKTSRL